MNLHCLAVVQLNAQWYFHHWLLRALFASLLCSVTVFGGVMVEGVKVKMVGLLLVQVQHTPVEHWLGILKHAGSLGEH